MQASNQMQVRFAIPGELASPTGGYAYARRVLRELPKLGVDIAPLMLPGGFPNPDQATLAETRNALLAPPAAGPILLDGLAGGAIPAQILHAAPGPIIMLCHHPLALETGIEPADAKRLYACERAALEASAHVITTSHATANILLQDYSVDPDKLTVVPPGTDPAPRAPADGPCRILSVGSVTARKRHDMLLDALCDHLDAEWSLQIAGATPDLQMLTDLKERAERTDLKDRVQILGPLSVAQLAAAYQNADLFVLASAYEGFGMAYTEAMSHGLPTLGIRCAAVEEATAGGAILTDDAGFSAALGTLLRDPKHRKASADQSWQTAQTFLRWPQTGAILADVLRKAAT